MNAFFYIMVLVHNNKVGFGITGNARDRLYDYIAATAEETQSFKYLYYGPRESIEELEATLKAEWRDDLWTVYKGNKWKTEILEPKSGKTAEDVKKWVNNKVSERSLPIREVKDEWLPYRGNKQVNRKYIDLNPDMYLEA